MKKHNLIKTIFRAIIIISAIVGVILNSLGSLIPLKQFAYFTVQSNVLVAVVYLVMIFSNKENNLMRLINNQAVVAIILTGLVYNLMLKPYISGDEYSPNTLSDILVHSLTPILVFFDFIFFTNHEKHKINEIFYNLTFPMLYWIFTLVFVALGENFNIGNTYISNYPYFFLNIRAVGIGYFLLVIAFILIISLLLYIIEWFISKKFSKKGVKNGNI